MQRVFVLHKFIINSKIWLLLDWLLLCQKDASLKRMKSLFICLKTILLHQHKLSSTLLRWISHNLAAKRILFVVHTKPATGRCFYFKTDFSPSVYVYVDTLYHQRWMRPDLKPKYKVNLFCLTTEFRYQSQVFKQFTNFPTHWTQSSTTATSIRFWTNICVTLSLISERRRQKLILKLIIFPFI